MDRLGNGGGEVIALTRDGKPMGSRDFAGFMETLMVRSTEEVTFVIGGAFGLGPGILARSNRKLSLSSMTLPHELARVLLLEQVYRGFTILRGHPYHR